MGMLNQATRVVTRARAIVALISVSLVLLFACPGRAFAAFSAQDLAVAETPSSYQLGVSASAVPESAFSVNGLTYEVNHWVADDSYYAVVCGFASATGSREHLVIPDVVASPLDKETTFPVSSIAAGAFEGCTTLKSVTFEGSFGGRIASYAFYGCTALESVTFSDECTLSRKGSIDAGSVSSPIGMYAFGKCTSLETIEVPAISSAASKSKYNFTMDIGHWHGNHTPVAVNGDGIARAAFSGCTSLRSIAFRAGHEQGAYAYFNTSTGFFEGCHRLRSLVFEGKQSFWMNPDAASVAEGSNGSQWDWTTDDDWDEKDYPTLYYAVDFYADRDTAEADDSIPTPGRTHGNRLARVEFARGTTLSDIATGQASTNAVAGDYAKEGYADGAVPDAATAAGHAGEDGWAWAFQQPYGYGETLMESCYAYPVKSGDLSAGHLSSTVIEQMRFEAFAYLEPWFDIERYVSAADASYASPETMEGIPYQYRHVAYSGAASFTLLADGNFQEPFDLIAADGSVLVEGRDYTRSFKRYDERTGVYVEMEKPDGIGPYLLCLTGAKDSAYAGTTLEIWVLLKHHALSYSFTQNSGEGAAKLTASALGASASTNSPYAVLVDDADSDMLFLGAAFAGFARAPIAPTTDGEYGAALRVFAATLSGSTTKRVLGVGISNSTATAVGSTGIKPTVERYAFTARYNTASKLAVAAYDDFNANLARFGVGDKVWGSTAVLCPSGLSSDYASMAAYAYSMRSPVFFMEADGSVSDVTLDRLASFDAVAVPGPDSVVSASVVEAIEAAQAAIGKTACVKRIGADCDGPCAFSLAVADELMGEGAATCYRTSIVAAFDPTCVTTGLTVTGVSGGIVLSSCGLGDTKRIVGHMSAHGYADSLGKVNLMEPGKALFSSDSWDFAEQLDELAAGGSVSVALSENDRFGAGGWVLRYIGNGQVSLVRAYDSSAILGVGSTVRFNGSDYLVVSQDPYDSLDYSGSDLAQARIDGVEDKTYTGGELVQNPVVAIGTKTLVNDVDYRLSYSDNVNAGTATLTVTGIGGYTGSLSANFNISKADQPMQVKASQKKVKRSKLKKKKIAVSPLAVTKAQGSVSYAKKGGSKALSVNKKSGKVTVKKGTKTGTYRMTVAVTAKGDGNYEAATKEVTVKVKVK